MTDTLEETVETNSNGSAVLVVQMMTCLVAISSNRDPVDYSIFVQICAISTAIIKKVTNLMSAMETWNYISKYKNETIIATIKPSQAQFGPQDTNIWDGHENEAVFDENKRYTGGTLDNLILRLTTIQDSAFQSTFILTYGSFVSHEKLFNKLLQRYNVPKTLNDKQEISRIRLRVAVVIRSWINMKWNEVPPNLQRKVLSFISTTLKKDIPQLAEKLLQDIQKCEKSGHFHGSGHDKQREDLVSIEVPEGGQSASRLCLNFSLSEIARQLCLIDWSFFKNVSATGLLKQAWSNPKLQYRAYHVIEMITRSNEVSMWVATNILMTPDLNRRVKVIETFIKIAENLKIMANFQGMMGFVAGLNISAVTRLHKTWAVVDKHLVKNLEDLQTLMHPSNSSKLYRAAHKEATSRGPCIPYLYIWLSCGIQFLLLTLFLLYLSAIPLRDLTFTEDGNPNFLQDNKNLINFYKQEVIADIIRTFQLNLQPPYTFPKVEPLHTFLSQLYILSESQLFQISLILEPRPKQQ